MWSSTVQRALTRSLKGVGIDRHIRIHDLRHTCGSPMHQRGVSAKEIQNILGHEDIQTTLNLYVHTSPETLRDAVDILGEAIA